MKKTWVIIAAIIAIANVVYSFWKPDGSYSIFSIEINIWIYRLIWSIGGVSVIYEYYKNKRNKQNG